MTPDALIELVLLHMMKMWSGGDLQRLSENRRRLRLQIRYDRYGA